MGLLFYRTCVGFRMTLYAVDFVREEEIQVGDECFRACTDGDTCNISTVNL